MNSGLLETSFPAPAAESCAASDHTAVTQPARVLSFEIPLPEEPEFCARLSYESQKHIRRMLRLFAGAHAAARYGKAKELRDVARKLGCSEQTARRDFYKFCRAGDWRVLVNESKEPAKKTGLPKEFIRLWETLVPENQRCAADPRRKLLEIWRTHRLPDSMAHLAKEFAVKGEYATRIPGYATWPEANPTTGVPNGWTESNLYRHLPKIHELTLGRLGRAAASQHRLKVYRTRVGLKLGEFMQFDDHEYNVKVNFPGQSRAMRPRGFSAVDVLSASTFAKSFKPTLWDLDEEKKKTLTEKDFAWFVVHVLCDFGFRKDDRGTALCVEHGMAAIRAEFEQRIADATGGRVRVERGGKFHAEQKGSRLEVASQMRGQTKGNFRFKALIESFWNLIDNYLAGIPGQVGKDRNHAPERVHGEDRYNNQLLKLEAVLPANVGGLLRKPFYSWPEFLEFAIRAYEAIDKATDHKCEGWVKCGFEQGFWRLNETTDWMPDARLLDLSPDERTLANALLTRNPLLHQVRKLSRGEVFGKLRHELSPLPPFHWPALMGPENALRGGSAIAVVSGEIVFEDKDLDSDPIKFRAVDDHGQRLLDQYVCFVNPFNLSKIVLCDAKLRVRAVCPRIEPSCHNDTDGIHRQMGEARAWEAAGIKEFESKHRGQANRLLAMRAHNASVIQQATPADLPAPMVTEDSMERLLREDA